MPESEAILAVIALFLLGGAGAVTWENFHQDKTADINEKISQTWEALYSIGFVNVDDMIMIQDNLKKIMLEKKFSNIRKTEHDYACEKLDSIYEVIRSGTWKELGIDEVYQIFYKLRKHTEDIVNGKTPEYTNEIANLKQNKNLPKEAQALIRDINTIINTALEGRNEESINEDILLLRSTQANYLPKTLESYDKAQKNSEEANKLLKEQLLDLYSAVKDAAKRLEEEAAIDLRTNGRFLKMRLPEKNEKA